MGVSFKVARVGTRFRHKCSEFEEKDEIFEAKSHEEVEGQRDVVKKSSRNEADIVGGRDHSSVHSNSLPGSYLSPQDLEVSFTVNIFPDGYSVEKPSEILRDVPKLLLPYNRASKMLFSAIEYGLLPGDVLDDIPCKFVDGTLCCEVRDYRKCVSKSTVCSLEKPPIVHKVCLQMCVENVVRDISSISDGSWTYNDLLQVESRILKSLQPELCLDPTPLLDRLCGAPVSKKLNLGIFEKREERKQNKKSSSNLVSNNISTGNNISSNEFLENPVYKSYPAVRDGGVECVQHNTSRAGFLCKQQDTNAKESIGHDLPMISQSKHQAEVNSSTSLSIPVKTPSNYICISESVQKDTSMGFPSKKQNTIAQESFVHESPLTSQSKYQAEVNNSESLPTRVTAPSNFTSILESAQQDCSTGFLSKQQNTIVNSSASLCGKRDGVEPQLTPFFGVKRPKQTHPDSVHVQPRHGQMDPVVVGPGVQQNNTSHVLVNNTPEAIIEEIPRLQSGNAEMGNIRGFNRAIDIRKEQLNPLQSNVQRYTPHSRAHIPSLLQRSQMDEKDLKGVDSTKEGRTSQAPQLSSPASSCSQPANFSKGTTRKCAKVNAKEKKSSLAGKRKYNSRTKTACRVGSPARASNGGASCRESTPKSRTPSSLPPTTELGPMFERFSKIKLLTERYKLNAKKTNFDFQFKRKQVFGTNQLLAFHLSNSDNNEDVKSLDSDEIFMARLLLWRSLKISLTRLVTYMRRRRIYHSTGFPIIVRESKKLIMSENPEDGKVDVYVFYGDDLEKDTGTSLKYYVQHLPNMHTADLYAAQFHSLMRKEGYELMGKQIQPAPFQTIGPQLVESGESPILSSGQSSNQTRNISLPIMPSLLEGQTPPPGNAPDYLSRHCMNMMASQQGYNRNQMVYNPVLGLLQQQNGGLGMQTLAGVGARRNIILPMGCATSSASPFEQQFPSFTTSQADFIMQSRISQLERSSYLQQLHQREELERMQRNFCIAQDPTHVSLEHIRRQTMMKSQHIYEETLTNLQQQSNNARVMMMGAMSTQSGVTSIADSPIPMEFQSGM